MNVKLLIGMGLALALGACASSPQPNAALETAKAAVQSAEADPNVSKYSALDLEAAKKDLDVAQTAAMHHRDAEIAQPAYLAAQTARLAQVRAAAKADDARVAAGQVERDRIQLAARSREVQNAEAATSTARAQTSAATEQSARLQKEIDQLKATPTDRGLVLTLGDVLFDTGKSELNSGASRKLDQLAQFLSEHPERRVQIDGFTDSIGSDAYNQELSRRRADSVKSALLTRGIGASRIGTEGYGKAFPVANNSDSGGRQLNRRVEVVIGGDNGTPIAPRS
ncbi:MAG TPA: OmpA family protein [Steroidobacteraceae bacterium]|nr:OmpA family protein [Steroidobacteraceae bacterium]